MVEYIKHTDAKSLGRAMAEDILSRYVLQNGRFLLGCPGGRSPKPIYNAMADIVKSRNIDLSRMVIVMMDDYVVATENGFAHVDEHAHYSCRRFGKEDILGVLNAGLPAERRILETNLWFPDPAHPGDYELRLEDAMGIDYFILASGAGDGHVAFNPPGSLPDTLTRVVKLGEQTRRDNLVTFPEFGGLNDVPTHGVTVGIETIVKNSRAAGLVLWGSDKGRALRVIRDFDAYDSSWPASVILSCKNATIHTDQLAEEVADQQYSA